MDLVAGTAFFIGAAVLLLVSSGLMTAAGLRRRDGLRLSFAVILLGFGGAMAYEAFAFGTGLAATISLITALAYVRHPAVWLFFFLSVLGLAGALSLHFLNLGRRAHWWVWLAGMAAYVVGGLLAWWLGWTP